MTANEIAGAFQSLQQEIIEGLELAEGGKKFHFDHWERPEGGGGRSAVLSQGAILEKGGVNFSAVEGPLHPNVAKSLGVEAHHFFATGVSIVLHPHNPLVPIIHMNVRYFETEGGMYWFGGGIDLTPHYIKEEQAVFFHGKLKETCDRFDPHFYPRFKAWADDYFYIKHREETRGIGGIFFDRLNEKETGYTKSHLQEFVFAVGRAFLPIYTHFMKELASLPFTEAQKQWQLIRRGRYVEFNLVYDRGTRFGLDTGGRIESILMSLPALASWEYNHVPRPNSEEAKTLSLLRKGIDWISE